MVHYQWSGKMNSWSAEFTKKIQMLRYWEKIEMLRYYHYVGTWEHLKMRTFLETTKIQMLRYLNSWLAEDENIFVEAINGRKKMNFAISGVFR